VRGVRNPISPTGGFFISTPLVIGVPFQTGIAIGDGFAVSGDAVVTAVVDPTPKSRQKSRAGGDGFSRALGIFIRALLRNVVEGVV